MTKIHGQLPQPRYSRLQTLVTVLREGEQLLREHLNLPERILKIEGGPALKTAKVRLYVGLQGVTLTLARISEGEMFAVANEHLGLLGYASSSEGDQKSGLLEQGKLVGLVAESGRGRNKIYFRFSPDGTLKLVERAEGQRIIGKFMVVWAPAQGSAGGVMTSDKVVALIQVG